MTTVALIWDSGTARPITEQEHYMPRKVVIQLLVTGIDGVPRVFLHQKSVKARRPGGWATEWTRVETYWRCLGVFDRPRWCRLVDKPVNNHA